MPTTDPTSPVRAPRALAGLVSVLTLLTLELVRSSGPLLDMTFSLGVVEAALAAVVAYGVLPGVLTALLGTLTRHHAVRTLVTGAFGLAVVRVLVQVLEGWLRFAVGLVAVALALAVLTGAVALVARFAGGASTAARAVALGAGAGVGLQLLLGTWDAIWRHDVVGWSVTLVLALVLVLLTRRTVRALTGTATPTAPRPPGRLWALGPVTALLAMVVANPAFAASQSGAPLAVAGPVTAVGLLLAAALAVPERALPEGSSRFMVTSDRLQPWVDGVLLVGLTVAVVPPHADPLSPWATLVWLVLLQALVVIALRRCLGAAPAPGPDASGIGPRRVTSGVPAMTRRPWRTGVVASAVGLGTILPLLVFQLDYDVPLGFPNELVVAATALVLALAAALGRRAPRPVGTPSGTVPVALVGVAVVVVLAGSAALVAEHLSTRSRSAEAVAPVPGEARLLSWNLHYGVDPTGDVDLERVARTIEGTGSEVVLLQEVPRGWVMGAGVDAATWLAHRLDMRVAFAPAADRQFGNAILARGPLDDVRVVDLPYGAGPQERSALRATVPAGGGTLEVVSVHLQHRAENTPTRLEQLGTLLDAIADVDGPLVIGGDLNAEPGWPEIELIRDAGLMSTQDAVGDPSLLTSPSTDPRHRIDWIFVRDVEPLRQHVLTDALSSDHLPLTATVRVADTGDAG